MNIYKSGRARIQTSKPIELVFKIVVNLSSLLITYLIVLMMFNGGRIQETPTIGNFAVKVLTMLSESVLLFHM